MDHTAKNRLAYHVGLIALSFLLPILMVSLFLFGHSQIPVDNPTTQPQEPTATAPATPPQGTTLPTLGTTQPTQVTVPTKEPVNDIMDQMTLEEKIYQLFIVAPEQLTKEQAVIKSGETMRLALGKHPVGGLVFFKANLLTRNQTAQMLKNAQSYSRLGLFLSVDEEGGTVARLGNNPLMNTTKFPSMGSLQSADKAYQVGVTIGREIRELGFNLDFAPVADVNSNPVNPVIGNRAFSSDPVFAGQMVSSCVRGFLESNMICTLKHFPGHGDTKTDSHLGAAGTNKTLDQLRECEFLPFRSGLDAGAPMVMVGHIGVPRVTGDDTPSTLSKTIITQLLREELGFEGVVITDSLMMGSITQRYSSSEAAVLALEAGADILLLPEDLQQAFDAVLSALQSGRLSEERINQSVRRILKLKLDFGII